MIRRLKDKIRTLAVHESPPKLPDIRLEFVWNQNFVRECREREVEVVGQLGILQALRFGDAVPNFREILRQGFLEVGQRS